MSSCVDWRELQVNRDSKYDGLVSRFCATKNTVNTSTVSVFKTIKEFMVFAALVGFEHDKYEAISSSRKVGITLKTYNSTDHDSYIYLLALSRGENLDILKRDNLQQAISHFEAYCNAGLAIIYLWTEKNEGQDIAGEILFNEAFEFLTCG